MTGRFFLLFVTFTSHLSPSVATFSALQSVRFELDDHPDGSHHHQQQQQNELELHGCEVAALMNLVGTDTMVEEALALIPSLSRFPEAALDEILDLIRNTMIRVVS